MSTAAELDDDLIGSQIGGYRIVEAIGRGGMGAVYRAVQAASDAEVAIKVLARDLVGDRESSERFVNEARIANRVRHEGLVKVLFVGLLADDRPYLIMEHLTGRPLSQLIGAALPLGTLLRRLAEAARAIGAMHDGGVLHRDLKPANLFVTTAGYIKVLDFGIAKLADERSGLTRTGHTIGTAEYMSPEQAQAEPLDERSDIYSFGVLLYEVVVGSRPFDGRLVDAIVSQAAPPPLPRHLPRDLDAVIQRAMAFDARDRYAKIVELAGALDAIAKTLPPGTHGALLEVEVPERAVELVTDRPPTAEPATPPPTVQAKKPVSRLGRYVVQGTAGRGGEGVVLIGVDPKVQRKVALKLLEVETADRRARLLAEAQAMARVSHPNVVTLYELGEDGERMFLAMEYLEAVDLERWLDDEKRAWRDIVAMFVEAGRGLAAAHAVGVIHRDFKPANVLLGKDGRPRVGDFGIAELHARTGDGAGTPAFMAPEQVDGGTVDARADQFAFCSSLWRALHGEAPFAGKTAMAIALAVRRGELRDPANASVPASITKALRRGLSVAPVDRFPDMTALLAALAADPPRRSRLLIGGGIVLAAAGAVASIALTRGSSSSTPAPPTRTLAEIRALPDAMERLRAIAAMPVERRGDPAVRAVAREAVSDGFVRTIVLEVDPLAELAGFSSSGTTFVVPTAKELVLIATSTGELRRVPGPGRVVRRIFLDDERAQLRVLTDDEVLVSPADGHAWKTAVRCDYAGMSARRVEASRDLSMAACIGKSTPIFVDGIPRGVTVEARDQVAFAATGRSVLVRRDGAIEVFDFRAAAAATEQPIGRRGVAPAVFAVSDRLATYVDGERIVVWDPTTGADDSSPGAADRLELAGRGDAPIVIASTGTRSRALLLSRVPALRVLRITAPRAVTTTAAGHRLLELSSKEVIVRDFARGTGARLRGAPGMAIGDGTSIALLDGRRLRLWRTDGATSATITGLYQRSDRHTLVTAAPGGRGPLRAWGVDGKLLDEIPDPAARLLLVRGLFVVQDGATSRWTPTKRTRERIAEGALVEPFEHAGEYYATAGGTLVRVRDGAPACGGTPFAVSRDGATVLVRSEQTLAACRLPAATRTELAVGFELASATTVTSSARWVVSHDGARAAAVDRGRLALFDTRTGTALPLGKLADLGVDYVELAGDRMLVVAKQGLFVVVDGAPIEIGTPALYKGAQLLPAGDRAIALVEGRLLVWSLAEHDRAPIEVGMVADPDAPLTAAVAFDDHVAVYSQRGDTGTIAVWSLAVPTMGEVETWLARVR